MATIVGIGSMHGLTNEEYHRNHPNIYGTAQRQLDTCG